MHTLMDEIERQMNSTNRWSIQVHIPKPTELPDLMDRCGRGDMVALRHVACIKLYGRNSMRNLQDKWVVDHVINHYDEITAKAQKRRPRIRLFH